MKFTVLLVSLIAAFFAGILVMLEIGRRLGVWLQARRQAEGDSAHGVGALEAAVFALLGLMIAFTFQGAASRFDQRRMLIVDEANSIGTAWLRIDLLPAAVQPEMRELFRQYLDSRLRTYRLAGDSDAVNAELENTTAIQQRIWRRAVAAEADGGMKVVNSVLPALNQMFDIMGTRTAAVRVHPPFMIFVMLFFLAATSAIFAGYGMSKGRRRSWLHILGYAVVLTSTVYVILDLEYPRFGWFQVSDFDVLLRNLRDSM
jgi:hypothetical protein